MFVVPKKAMSQKRHSRKSSLFSQLLAGFAISLTTVGLATLSLNYLLVASNLEHEAQEEAEAIARSIDFANKGLLETGNIRALQQIVQKYATLPEVVEVLIIDPKGNTLAHTNFEEQHHLYKSIHPELISVVQQVVQTGVEAHRFMRMHGKPVIVYLSPFQSELFNISERHGLILVVINREIEQQKAQQIFWQSSATMGIGILLIFTTKPVGKGTGLGLSISYQIIVERHSGRLYCYSKVGQGTEFVIEIPVCQDICKAA